MRFSTRPIERHIVSYTHIIRAGQDDPMTNMSITDQRESVKADFRRVGRPRVKWYGTTRGHIVTLLRKEAL